MLAKLRETTENCQRSVNFQKNYSWIGFQKQFCQILKQKLRLASPDVHSFLSLVATVPAHEARLAEVPKLGVRPLEVPAEQEDVARFHVPVLNLLTSASTAGCFSFKKFAALLLFLFVCCFCYSSCVAF